MQVTTITLVIGRETHRLDERMKLLVVLFAAAVLTSEISAYTYRGDDGVGSVLPVPERCRPGSCVVEYGQLCYCDGFGISVCPVSYIYDSPSPIDDLECNCEPGTVLPSTNACVCPDSGKIPVTGCGRMLSAPAAKPEVKRQSDDAGVGSSRDSDGRRCGYYQCWPTQNGQQCIWIPCSNGR